MQTEGSLHAEKSDKDHAIAVKGNLDLIINAKESFRISRFLLFFNCTVFGLILFQLTRDYLASDVSFSQTDGVCVGL